MHSASWQHVLAMYLVIVSHNFDLQWAMSTLQRSFQSNSDQQSTPYKVTNASSMHPPTTCYMRLYGGISIGEYMRYFD